MLCRQHVVVLCDRVKAFHVKQHRARVDRSKCKQPAHRCHQVQAKPVQLVFQPYQRKPHPEELCVQRQQRDEESRQRPFADRARLGAKSPRAVFRGEIVVELFPIVGLLGHPPQP